MIRRDCTFFIASDFFKNERSNKIAGLPPEGELGSGYGVNKFETWNKNTFAFILFLALRARACGSLRAVRSVFQP